MSILRENQSVANFFDKSPDENEDAFIAQTSLEKSISWYTMCDGAGGVGVFNKEWANFLAAEINCNVINAPNLNELVTGISEKFYESVISKKDLSDLLLSKKLYRDGSYSTLNVCWIEKMTNTIYYTSVGDTCLFIFEKINEQYVITLNSTLLEQDSFDQATKLINWNSEVSYPITIKSKVLSDATTLIMATDSLAKWILLNIFMIDFDLVSKLGFNETFISRLSSEQLRMRKEAMMVGSSIKSISELLNFLEKISISNELFIDNVKTLQKQNELDMDDFSLAIIKFYVS